MKRVRSFCVLLALAASVGCASSNPADREALLARVDQFHVAIRDGDPQSYADLFTEDFLFTWSRDGQLYSKEVILPNVVPTPDFRPLIDEYQVRAYERAAVVSFRVRKETTDPGVRVTFSYVKQRGVWKVMASHSTAIVEGRADEPEATTEAE
jgi:hypothetical protein